ncbi:HalD/BesD family halogenase [Streptomyces hydrogenans]|uniref:HalD/BesD family halogenase n=1 Tax=Streptomyces hydrogenans TaxID=1873719 RepID=UPI003D7507BE
MPSLLDADVLTRLGPDGADRFARDGYLALPGLLTGEGLAVLGREATGLEAVARRRDFAMACMDDSPRHMTTLGGHVIGRASTLILPPCTGTGASWGWCGRWRASRSSRWTTPSSATC